MTKQTNWKVYNGSDEQISEISSAKNGLSLMFEGSPNSFVYKLRDISTVDGEPVLSKTVTHYWLIPDDPLREMKIRQAQTGQPVWWRIPKDIRMVTTTPGWKIPNAEYSFTESKD